jgi:hypothetical protein
MTEKKPDSKNDSAIAIRPANPDGKGTHGFLLDWQKSDPRGVVAKPRRQVLAEFFTSMLVLSAKFQYKPTVGVPNFLYLLGDEWTLSLISPEEWSSERRAGFVATCVLQTDMTWTIVPSENIAGDQRIADAIGRFYDAFADNMDTDLTLEEILPTCVGQMPYYQRLYANALSRSINAAMILGGQTAVKASDWRVLLPKPDEIGRLEASRPIR